MDKLGQAAELKNILEMVLLPLSFLESSNVNRTLSKADGLSIGFVGKS
ncbi:hypothetical protein ABEY80_26485 [Priestia megaterium]